MTTVALAPAYEDAPLFADVNAYLRSRLVESAYGGLLPGEKVVDLFCGGGGWGAGGMRLGLRTDYAVNHSPIAIETHRQNHPWCQHHQGDAWKARPRDVVGRQAVGLLLASAACTTHSRARGAAPISPRVHMLGWCIARWIREVRPRIVIVENVIEWQRWGPLVIARTPRGKPMRDEAGRLMRVADAERQGSHFRRWVRYCRRQGYEVEFKVMDAADFGSPSRRKRLFVVMRRDGMPIVWPEVTHGTSIQSGVDSGGVRTKSATHRGRAGGRPAGQEVVGGDVPELHSGRGRADRIGDQGVRQALPCRTAQDVIDWSDLGTSIFGRRRPLADKTLARIAEGIRRFVLHDPRPFVMEARQVGVREDGSPRYEAVPFVLRTTQTGGGYHVRRVDEPMATQTTRQDLALATPILATTGYGERDGQASRVHRVTELIGTCVNGAKQAVVTPVMVVNTSGHPGGRVDEPAHTVTTGGQIGMCAPVMAYLNHGGKQTGRVDEPLRTVVAGGGHAMLVAPLLTTYHGTGGNRARVTQPLPCVTTVDGHGLVSVVIDGVTFVIVDILFRMLRPAELARAMGFPDDYRWPKSARETTKLIGNAVSVHQAEALLRAVLPRLDGRRECVAC